MALEKLCSLLRSHGIWVSGRFEKKEEGFDRERLQTLICGFILKIDFMNSRPIPELPPVIMMTSYSKCSFFIGNYINTQTKE